MYVYVRVCFTVSRFTIKPDPLPFCFVVFVVVFVCFHMFNIRVQERISSLITNCHSRDLKTEDSQLFPNVHVQCIRMCPSCTENKKP